MGPARYQLRHAAGRERVNSRSLRLRLLCDIRVILGSSVVSLHSSFSESLVRVRVSKLEIALN
jgi:hypothetical protein